MAKDSAAPFGAVQNLAVLLLLTIGLAATIRDSHAGDWPQWRRAAGRPTERSCVVAEDLVYIVTGKEIHAYETATGKASCVIAVPEGLEASIYNAPTGP